MNARLLVLLLAASLAPAGAAAGAPATSARDAASALYHKSWTKQDGAPTAVYGVTQDSRGMLWFTSTTGLFRFDGAHFQRLVEIDGNPLTSPATNMVQALGDALWVAYSFGGVSVFEHGKVRHYGPADGLPLRTVYNVSRTIDGTVWLTSASGLFRQQGERWQRIVPADGLPDGSFQFMTALPDGTLLVFHPSGVYRTLPGTFRFRRVVARTDIETGKLRNDGKVLLVSVQHRMQLFDPATEHTTPLPLPAGSAAPLDVTLDGHDNIWISTGQGLQLLGHDLRPVRTFSAPHQFSGSMLYNDLRDREGNVWFTTDKGVDYIRPARLTVISLPPRMFGGLSVVADRAGTLWIGNTSTTGSYEQTSFGLGRDGRHHPLDLHSVTATTRASDGSVWFANSREVWHQAGARSRRWRLPATLHGQEVQALAVGADGRLWLSVVAHGVGTFTDGVWQPGGGHAELADSPAVSLHADARGRVWFGYPRGRLAMLDGATVHRYDSRDGVDVGTVLVIASRGDRVWIGGSEGLALLRGGRFRRLNAADSLPFYGVSGLVETAAGELWLQGADGLARIGAPALAAAHGDAVAVERFDYLDGHEGVPSAIRPLNSLTEAPDGKLWYATTASVGWIDPAHIVRNPLAPAPQITALKTAHHDVPLGADVRLPTRTDDLQIDFTAAALSIPARVRFRYRLLGLDTAWRDASPQRQAFYTNLGPGAYRFEVLAANEDGVWNPVPATLAFQIAPSLTQTWWFKVACAVAVLVALYLLYLARLAQLTARLAERHQERAAERDRIARTLHDTFLQSVQALILRVDLIKLALPGESPARRQIDAALDVAQQVLDEGREQVLDLRVSDAHPLDLGAALREYGAALAEQGGFAFVLEVMCTARPLRTAVRAEALAIGKEALANAARHSAGTVVTVELGYSPQMFRLSVGDDGRGIDATVQKAGKRPGHWGLDGMRERAVRVGGALAVDSRAGAGTMVTLTLAARDAYE
jgi:signal transduction histidine kinase/ligand-binding sensor domain-containing protein